VIHKAEVETLHVMDQTEYGVNARVRRIYAGIVTFLFMLLVSMSARAQVHENWPCFHGPERNNKSGETGFLTAWPESGPSLLWTVSGLGEGYSTVSIADGLVFASGKKDDRTYVFAFDLDGEPVWEMPNGRAWATTMSHARSYTGARSTPTYDSGVVYHLGETGRLAAFDHRTGKELWFVDLRERFDADIPEYGFAESVLIDGDHLYCNPAGKKAFMVCLDKKDGRLIWANTSISGEAGYSSPVLADIGGFHHVINLSSDSVYGVDRLTGKLLWSVPFEGDRSLNNTDVVVHGEYVFASSGYGKGSMLLKLVSSGGRIVPETVWTTDLLDNHHGGVILHDGFLYGAGHNARGWFCLDFKTGKELWMSRGKGSLVYADNMLYLLEEKGDMKLVKATSGSYEELASFTVPSGGKGMYWAHPVVCGGRLYVRHTDNLYAYDIK